MRATSVSPLVQHTSKVVLGPRNEGNRTIIDRPDHDLFTQLDSRAFDCVFRDRDYNRVTCLSDLPSRVDFNISIFVHTPEYTDWGFSSFSKGVAE